MKKIIATFSTLLFFGWSFSQYPLVSIQDIQTRSNPDLISCNDTSLYLGDTVRVRGVVMTHPDSARYTASGNRAQFWLQSGINWFNGINVFQPFDPGLNGVDNLVSGDSVEITGEIFEYQHETELMPINGVSVSMLGSVSTYPPVLLDLGELNDGSQINHLPGGEKWEGMYVEIQNVTVVQVNYFFANARVGFTVQDSAGNLISVEDKFLAQQMPISPTPGIFVPPSVGDSFCHLRGIVVHSGNGCTGNGGRGYLLQPFKASDYVVCLSYPDVLNVQRTIVTPTSSQDEVVTADIFDANGITSAILNYAVGEVNPVYIPITMTDMGGGIWEGVIPALPDSSFVKYYVCATNTAGLTSCEPDLNGGFDPQFYIVRDSGTSIYDIQYVPVYSNSGSSGYEDMVVTVSGTVTASAQPDNLGYVYIQEEGVTEWSGVMLTENVSLFLLEVGDKVTVTGTVSEFFGFTIIQDITSVVQTGTGNIPPIVLSPDIFTNWILQSNEKYEGMLLTLVSTFSPNYIVAQSADSPSNYGEYRVGTDQFDPTTGCRILAGRQSSSAFSSLNVSYINDSIWETTDGNMNVASCVVPEGLVVDSISGVLLYSFSNFKLTPRNDEDFVFGVSADFNWTNSGLETSFTNLSSNSSAYEWSFGDGNSSITSNPVHNFASSGTYDVCLIAGEACISDTVCNSITVSCLLPSSGFSFSDSGLVVNFSDLSSNSPDTWNWDFGDGITSTDANPLHIYNASGTYDVCLITSNSCGTDSICQEITVTCPLIQPSFTWLDDQLEVSFSGSATGAPDTWQWDFGDGNTSTQQNPDYIYPQVGTYQVCLTVSDNCGADSTCQVVTITCPLIQPSFTWLDDQLEVSFTGSSSGTPESWQWDFGDGNISTQQNPNHIYSDPGIYVVCLATTDACGTSESCDSIMVDAVALKNKYEKARIKIFPNPSNGKFLITSDLGKSGTYQLEILDVQGALVYQREGFFSDGLMDKPVELFGMNRGIYLVRISITDCFLTVKIVKE